MLIIDPQNDCDLLEENSPMLVDQAFVKNCEGEVILPYFQTNKLAYHTVFVAIGRRWVAPESKTKKTLLPQLQ